MTTRSVLFLAAAAMVMLAPVGRAQTGRAGLPSLALESLTGRDSFDRYCASCHGADGRGAGPVAGVLKTRPPDLTTLARRNKGSFPRQQVAAFIDGSGRTAPAHGTGDMPVWGSTFRGLDASDVRVKVRLDNLVAYVESLQRPLDETGSSAAAGTPTGAQLFRTYCASCHGDNAAGAGPLSGQLTRAVPDLTTFTTRNGGMFPAERVRQMIEGRGPAAHGDRSMPVWGDAFRREGSNASASARIDALVTYLQSIQRRPAE